MRFFIFFLLVLIINQKSYSQQLYENVVVDKSKALSCSSRDGGTILLYVNGQSNTPGDIDSSLLALNDLNSILPSLKYDLDEKGKISFEAINNLTTGKINGVEYADYLKSFALILQNSGMSSQNAWAVSYSIFRIGYSFEKIKSILGITNFTIDSAALNALRKGKLYLETAEAEISDELKQRMIDAVMKENKKLIIISHSQGNLFVNKSYKLAKGATYFDPVKNKNLLFNDYISFIGNAQIATPVNEILIPNHNYIINQLDSILLVDWLPGYRLFDPNFILFPPQSDEFPEYDTENFHGFLEAYLFGDAFTGLQPKGNNALELTNSTVQKWIDIAEKIPSNCGAPPLVTDILAMQDQNNPFRFSFSAQIDDIDGGQYSYSWNFGDLNRSTSIEVAPNFTYDKPGTYHVSLLVKDENDQSAPVFYKDIEIKIDLACDGVPGDYLRDQFGQVNMDVFIASTATVDSSVDLRGKIQVCGESKILGNTVVNLSNGTLRLNDNSIISSSSINGKGNILLENKSQLHSGVQLILNDTTIDDKAYAIHLLDASILGGVVQLTGNGARLRLSDNVIAKGSITNSGKIELSDSADLSSIGSIRLQDSNSYFKADKMASIDGNVRLDNASRLEFTDSVLLDSFSVTDLTLGAIAKVGGDTIIGDSLQSSGGMINITGKAYFERLVNSLGGQFTSSGDVDFGSITNEGGKIVFSDKVSLVGSSSNKTGTVTISGVAEFSAGLKNQSGVVSISGNNIGSSISNESGMLMVSGTNIFDQGGSIGTNINSTARVIISGANKIGTAIAQGELTISGTNAISGASANGSSKVTIIDSQLLGAMAGISANNASIVSIERSDITGNINVSGTSTLTLKDSSVSKNMTLFANPDQGAAIANIQNAIIVGQVLLRSLQSGTARLSILNSGETISNSITITSDSLFEGLVSIMNSAVAGTISSTASGFGPSQIIVTSSTMAAGSRLSAITGGIGPSSMISVTNATMLGKATSSSSLLPSSVSIVGPVTICSAAQINAGDQSLSYGSGNLPLGCN